MSRCQTLVVEPYVVGYEPCYAGFIPCRNERCDDDSLHPAHDADFVSSKNPRLLVRVCPRCSSPLIPLRRQRARCPACKWQGTTNPKLQKSQTP